MEAVIKRRKSVVLTKDEWKALKGVVKKYPTAVECAEAIGINRQVLERVMVLGRGSVETIEKVRALLSTEATNIQS